MIGVILLSGIINAYSSILFHTQDFYLLYFILPLLALHQILNWFVKIMKLLKLLFNNFKKEIDKFKNIRVYVMIF
jgi:hypothetical protein